MLVGDLTQDQYHFSVKGTINNDYQTDKVFTLNIYNETSGQSNDAFCQIKKGSVYNFEIECEKNEKLTNLRINNTVSVMDKSQLFVVIKEGQDDKLYDTANNNLYSSNNKKDKKLSNVAITFIVIACVLAIAIVVVAAIVIRKKYVLQVEKKRTHTESTLDNLEIGNNTLRAHNN